MSPDRSRRRFLATVGAAGGAALAGCPLENPDGTTETPSGDPVEVTPVDAPYDLSVDHDIESWAHYDPEWEPPSDDPTVPGFEVTTVIENMEVPWDVEFAGNGEFFVSERVGRISHYEAGSLEAVTEPADVIDHADAMEPGGEAGWWAGGSEGGLLGVALHPNYPDVPVCYAFYTYHAGGDDYRNRLVFYDVTEDDPDEHVVIDGIPGHRIVHNGSRLAFGPRNYLWVTTGDSNEGELAQDGRNLAGGILRLEPDGTPPEGQDSFADPRLFTIGHRNPQGISFLPDGTPIATQHGDQARDEVHILREGANYGWPEAESEEEYADSEFDRPLVNTGARTTWAPSGGVFYAGDGAPGLRNRFVCGGLISQAVHVISVYPRGEAPDIGGTHYDADWLDPEYDAVAHQLLSDELGRIRHLEQAPDGSLYAITSNRDGRADGPFPHENDDRVLRLTPA